MLRVKCLSRFFLIVLNLNGIESKYDLMTSKFGSYGEMNKSWSGEDVKGFSKIYTNYLSIYHQVNAENND